MNPRQWELVGPDLPARAPVELAVYEARVSRDVDQGRAERGAVVDAGRASSETVVPGDVASGPNTATFCGRRR